MCSLIQFGTITATTSLYFTSLFTLLVFLAEQGFVTLLEGCNST